MIPYRKGIHESFKNICGKMGVQVHFEGSSISRNLLVAIKDNITQSNTQVQV